MPAFKKNYIQISQLFQSHVYVKPLYTRHGVTQKHLTYTQLSFIFIEKYGYSQIESSNLPNYIASKQKA